MTARPCRHARPKNLRLNSLLRCTLLAFVLLAAVLLPAAMSAQTPTGEVRGTITDGANAEPVVHATVILAGTKLGAVTDMHGVFTVRRVPAGTYTVRISSVGYAPREFSDVR